MANSYVGDARAAATTVTIPAHQAGDLIIGYGYRDGNATPPTPDSGVGWTTLLQDGASGPNNAHTLTAKVAAGSSESFGTWSGVTTVYVLVLRGTADNVTDAIGALLNWESGAATTWTFEALTLEDTSGESWVVGLGGTPGTPSLSTAPTSLTERQAYSGAGHKTWMGDTNGGVSSWSGDTLVVSAESGARTVTFEVKVAASGQTVTGVALSASPSLPAATLDHKVTGVALAATPSLPVGDVQAAGGGQTVTGIALSATPSLPAGSLQHALSGVVLNASPTLPAGATSHAITGIALSATPTLPAGTVSVAAQTVTGVALSATPTLPVGALVHRIAGVALSATPSLPSGTVTHSLTGVPLTVAPTLPAGTLTLGPQTVTGVALLAAPVLPIGSVAAGDDWHRIDGTRTQDWHRLDDTHSGDWHRQDGSGRGDWHRQE